LNYIKQATAIAAAPMDIHPAPFLPGVEPIGGIGIVGSSAIGEDRRTVEL